VHTAEKNKRTKVSLFNARVSGSVKRNRNIRHYENNSQIRHYKNLNNSAVIPRKSRPRTYANKTHLASSDNLHSLSQIHGNRSMSRRRLKTSYKEKRRPMSSRKVHRKPKEQEVLITKTYDLCLNIPKNLSLGEEKPSSISKKISYVNKDDRECIFTVKSSHPDQMTFKNDEIIVEPGQKAKFGIRFKMVDEPKLAQYVLFLSKDGHPHENILLNVKYE